MSDPREEYMKSLRDSKNRRVANSRRNLQLIYSLNSSGDGRSSSGSQRLRPGATLVSAAAGSGGGSGRSVDGKATGTGEESGRRVHFSGTPSAQDVLADAGVGDENARRTIPEGSFESEHTSEHTHTDEEGMRSGFYPPSMKHLGGGIGGTSSGHESGQRRVAMHAATGTNAMTAWRELVLDSLHADLDEVDLDDDSEVEAVGHSLPVYAAPMQRQKWGEDQILPHINWGDLFFDLFYVAAAYNLGALLISAMSPDLWFHGIVYFVGIFGPLFNAWESKLVYESRYSVIDYFHRFVEVVRVFFLSFSVLHIKPMELMRDPRSAETFFFCLGLLLECCVRIFLKAELIRAGTGDREAIKNHSKRKLQTSYIPLAVFYLTAVVISGVGYWNQDGSSNGGGAGSSEYGDGKYAGGDKYDDGYNGTDSANGTGYEGHGSHDDDGHLRRMLAGGEDAAAAARPLGDYSTAWSIGDVPIILCAVAYLLNVLFTIVRKTIWLPNSSDFRKENVPSNIDFCIHRYGEWTMLMLGEAVLSLLIVETTEEFDYYFVALAGVLTVIMLQALHFESEPAHADHHALWRNMQAGTWYSMLLQLLSMGLIAFGVSYKVMLKGIHKQAQYEAKESGYEGGGGGGYGDKGSDDYDDGGGHRWLIEDTFIGGEGGGWGGVSGFFGLGRRYLAGSVSVTDQAAAALFCGSLTVVLISLELLTNLHRGMHENAERLFHHRVKGMVLRLEIFSLTAFKVGLILFLATLSQWLNDPKWVALVGFFVVACLAGTRVVGWNLIHGKNKNKKANKDSTKTDQQVPS